jgi:hypothetical protein
MRAVAPPSRDEVIEIRPLRRRLADVPRLLASLSSDFLAGARGDAPPQSREF